MQKIDLNSNREIDFDYRNQFQYKDRLLFYLFTNFVKTIGRPDPTGRAIANAIYGFFCCLLLFLFAGSEAVKLTLRRKMGTNEFSYIRIILSSAAFIGIGFLLFFTANKTFDAVHLPWFGEKVFVNEETILGTGVFFFLFGSFLFAKGISAKIAAKIKEDAKENILPSYTGDSILFNSLEKKGYKKSTIRNFFEPLSFLLFGLFSFFLNPFLGLPFVICALSYWLILLAEYIFGLEAQRVDYIMEVVEGNNNNIVVISS